MIPGGLPSLTDAVEGPHSPPAPGQVRAAPGTPQLSSSSAFEQWAAQGNPWRTGPGQRCVLTMLGLARGAAPVAGQRWPLQPARAACRVPHRAGAGQRGGSCGRAKTTLAACQSCSPCSSPCWGWPEGRLLWQGKNDPCSLPGPCPKASCLLNRAVGHADWQCFTALLLSTALLSTALACRLPLKPLTMHVADDHTHQHLQPSWAALSGRQGSPTKREPVSQAS